MPKIRDAMRAEITPVIASTSITMNIIDAMPTIATGQPQCCQIDDGKEVLRTRDPKMSPKTSKKMVPANPSEPATILRTPSAVGIQLG